MNAGVRVGPGSASMPASSRAVDDLSPAASDESGEAHELDRETMCAVARLDRAALAHKPGSAEARRLHHEAARLGRVVDEPDVGAHAIGVAPVRVWVGGVGGPDLPREVIVQANVVTSGSWRVVDGMLHDVPPEPDTSPEPDALWKQRVVIPPGEAPCHRQGAVEVWYGSPATPSSTWQYVEVRDTPAHRDPAYWRPLLGPVAFSLALRECWWDPSTPRPRARAGQPKPPPPPPPVPLGRWAAFDPTPSTQGPAGAPDAVWLSIAGVMVQLTSSGRDHDGRPVYAMRPDQVRALAGRLR